MRPEERYQAHLIDELEDMFPGCIVVRLDPRYVDFYIDGDRFSQGVLDLLVLFGGRVGTLEVKAYENAPRQPNQDYFVEQFDRVAFAAFICPENERDVLDGLSRSLRPERSARLSRS